MVLLHCSVAYDGFMHRKVQATTPLHALRKQSTINWIRSRKCWSAVCGVLMVIDVAKIVVAEVLGAILKKTVKCTVKSSAS